MGRLQGSRTITEREIRESIKVRRSLETHKTQVDDGVKKLDDQSF